MPNVEYLPIATSNGANVDSQAVFAGSTYQASGVQTGNASSSAANKIWRQASMMAAALANLISQELDTDVLDDGNLPALVSYLQQAITSLGSSESSNLQSQINTLNSEVSNLNSEFGTANSQINTLNSNVNTLNSEITSANTTASNQQQEITALQGKKIAGSESDVTGQRSVGTTFTNNTCLMLVRGYCSTAGSGTGTIATLLNGAEVWAHTATATVEGGAVGFALEVPAGASYQVTINGAINSLVRWTETLAQ